VLLPQSYIDFEIAEGERARTAALYERLLNRTSHVKVPFSCPACVGHIALISAAT
jgi:crooked neck